MHSLSLRLFSALILLVPCLAQAGLSFTLTRVSDTQTTISASGTFDPVEGGRNVILVDPFGSFSSGSTTLANNTMVTDRPSSLTSILLSDSILVSGSAVDSLRLVFTVSHVAGDAIFGGVDLTLPGGSLAPVGSSGEVWYGLDDGGQVITLTGTWEIVGPASAPLPATLPLLATGLLGLVVQRRRRQPRDS